VAGFAVGGPLGALLGVGCLAAASGAAACALAASIVLYGRHDHARPADCIVILGTSARPDGLPGPILEGRVRHAEALYRKGLAPVIVTTGGRGGPGRTESDAARRLALADGIPAGSVESETSSRNTWENFARVRDIMQAHGWTSCIVSTDPFHARRSIAIAREMGIDAVSSPAPVSRGLRGLVKECVSTVKYWNWRLGRAVGRG
jgi:uncharacterized SAM-binding protein YcdF (DUF218 family)